MPLLQAAITDYRGIVISFQGPATCSMMAAAYGVFGLKTGVMPDR